MAIPPPNSPVPGPERWPPCPGATADNREDLAGRLAAEMAERWRQGERPLVEEFLARHPELPDQSDASLRLIHEELRLRREFGLQLSSGDLSRRFPQWSRHLQIFIASQHRAQLTPQAPCFPAAGETLGDFRLVTELGRGARGRVFLATQPGLADRPVVVKFTPRDGQEHLSMARLQHTHIVPLYSVHDFPERCLLGLCMPYFGGTTLARLLDAVRSVTPAHRTGQQLLDILQEAQAAVRVPVPAGAPGFPYFARASYTEAICWVGACLAGALHHACLRGLVHLDVKPANVLLAAGGQPMLLDFHLARAPLAAGTIAPERLGGAPAYMAPEHQAVMAVVGEGGPVPLAVDGRADIYSLGAVLYQAFGGPIPATADRARKELRQCNPQVTAGLADLLARCLAKDPRDRYPQAMAVADDLHRHLDDLPLKGVRNRSPVERWRKWRRRRPLAPVLVGLLLIVITTGAFLVVQANRQLRHARLALAEGRDHLVNRRLGEARSAFQRGLALVDPLPLNLELTHELRDQLRRTERAQAVDELHRLVDGLRPYYGTASLSAEEARRVEAHCRRFWDQRGLICQRLEAQPDLASPQQVQSDLLDLAILWTDLFVARAADHQAAARQEALIVLTQAEELFGSSCVLDQERRSLITALGLPSPIRAPPPPRNAWEHCAMGRALLRAGDLPAAADQFQRALDLEPQGLWPNFYRGTCAYRQGDYPEALTYFSVCVALAPDRAWCFYNRGLALMALGREQAALRDFETALRLDPTLAGAALERNRVRQGQ